MRERDQKKPRTQTQGDQAIGGRSGVSIAAPTSEACSIECVSDIKGTAKVAGSDGRAAAIMQASAQLIPNDFAGQQGHRAFPSWFIDEWQ